MFEFIISVRANEGDAYVLGALPTGTVVHCIEKEPGLSRLIYSFFFIKEVAHNSVPNHIITQIYLDIRHHVNLFLVDLQKNMIY